MVIRKLKLYKVLVTYHLHVVREVRSLTLLESNNVKLFVVLEAKEMAGLVGQFWKFDGFGEPLECVVLFSNFQHS